MVVRIQWSGDSSPATVVRSDDSYTGGFAVLLCALLSFVILFTNLPTFEFFFDEVVVALVSAGLW